MNTFSQLQIYKIAINETHENTITDAHYQTNNQCTPRPSPFYLTFNYKITKRTTKVVVKHAKSVSQKIFLAKMWQKPVKEANKILPMLIAF